MADAGLPVVELPRTDSIHLREWLPSDAGALEEATLDPYIPATTTLPAVFSEAEMKAWIDRQVRRREEGIGYSMCIADAINDRALGMIGLWLRERSDGRGRIGYWLLPHARGRRIAPSALSLVAQWGFSSFPELARIELLIEPSNQPSLRTAERAGFSREGLLRSYQAIDGIRRDFYMYARIRSEGG